MATSNWDAKTGLKFEGETEGLKMRPRGDFLFFSFYLYYIWIFKGFLILRGVKFPPEWARA